MDKLNEIIKLIEAAIDWYFTTPLPKDTALAFYKIAKDTSDILLPLIYEYINLIF